VPLDPHSSYPVCTGGKRAAPPEDCGGAWAYLQRVDQHHVPLDVMATVATALERLLKPDDQTTIRQVIRDPETFRAAVDQLDVYLQFQPEHFTRRDVNARLRVLVDVARTFSALAVLLPGPITPEPLFLETKWAALMSYGVTAQLLHEVLPIDEALAPCTIREHVFKVTERLEQALGEEQWSFIDSCPAAWSRLPIPNGPLTVGIDRGYVRAQPKGDCREKSGGVHTGRGV
jgi:Plasmid pRiA4b ORF-3-like protein